jgi:hypothetical protein
MTQRLFYAVALVLVVLGFTSNRPEAQTVANGPYYALPSWNQKLPCPALNNCPRFVVLANWNSEAVLDRESGLVWERAPGTRLNFAPTSTWQGATNSCRQAELGGRMGWRVPTIEELQTLIDADTPDRSLPPGHPFTNIFTGNFQVYWSATRVFGTDFAAYVVGYNFTAGSAALNNQNFVWCVRGGSGVEPL